jgi:hypothetical protein
MLPARSADEEEGHAAGSRALEGGQAVADRLEAHAKLPFQQADVVAERLGGLQEAAVGQHQRAGKVAGEADAGEGAGFFQGKAAFARQSVDEAAGLEKGDLGGELEGLLPPLEARGQAQHPGGAVIAALGATVVLVDGDPHPVLGLQALGEGGDQIPAVATGFKIDSARRSSSSMWLWRA